MRTADVYDGAIGLRQRRIQVFVSNQLLLRALLLSNIAADAAIALKCRAGLEDRLTADRQPAHNAVRPGAPVHEIPKRLVRRPRLAVVRRCERRLSTGMPRRWPRSQ